MGKHLTQHGDGVKDVAFEVEDMDNIIKVFLVVIRKKIFYLKL